jgi:hypothetical protein
MRDLSPYIDQFGNISVEVEIGRGPGTRANGDTRSTGASAPPATVANFLRELADDVEAAASSQNRKGQV